MVEQEAVNFEVTGSSPVVGAIVNTICFLKATRKALTEKVGVFFGPILSSQIAA